MCNSFSLCQYFSADKLNELKTQPQIPLNSFRMPMKRSRAGSSTAYIETSSATAASLSQVKVMKTDDDDAEPSWPKLTVSSPVNVANFDRMKIGGFLERCHYCKKRIAQNSEVFMYSNFCAFCSDKCRDLQINLDKSVERKPKNPKGKPVEG